MTAIVEVRSLTKVFGFRGGDTTGFKAVDDVSFSVARGTCLGIVGESGSGKSTVARILLGLEQRTSGEIFVCGENRSKQAGSLAERRHRARQMQMVFQDPFSSLDRRQSGAECLDEVLRLHFDLCAAARRERIAALSDRVGLSADLLARSPKYLSGGQSQRLSIARSLAAEPAVLVLDEPVSALDVSVQAQVLNQLAEIRTATGITLIFISHDLAVINQVADEIVVMRQGKIVEAGATADVLGAPQHEYTQRLRDSVPGSGWRRRDFPLTTET